MLLLKTIKKIIISIIIIIAVVFLAVESCIIYTWKNAKLDNDAEYMIILGAKIHGDVPSSSLRNRLDAAIPLLKENRNMKVIVSGGKGHDEYLPEAIVMERYLLSHGIKKNRIIVEKKSENTIQNLKNSRMMIMKTGKIKVNIVTNDYHLLRADFLAKRCGFRTGLVAADTPKTVVIQSNIREVLAVIKSYFMD